jgi:hypothetical protein
VGDGFAALQEPGAPTLAKAVAATAAAVQGMGKYVRSMVVFLS